MKVNQIALTFDLQKCYVIPVLITNKAYYKHQSILHEGLHNMAYTTWLQIKAMRICWQSILGNVGVVELFQLL